MTRNGRAVEAGDVRVLWREKIFALSIVLLASLVATGCWKEPQRPRSSEEPQRTSRDVQEQSETPADQNTSGGKEGSGVPDLPTEPSEVLSAEEIYQKARASLVVVTAQGSEGRRLGSGFFSESGMIITNEHIISGASGTQIQPITSRSGNGRRTAARSVSEHPVADLAILRSSEERRGLPLGRFESASVGEPVFVAGNPKGLEATFSEGIVSGIRSREGTTVLQITAPVSKGSSGSPVLNESGEVIGVVFAVRQGGQNLNFAVPVSYVRETLQDTR